jgi:hypothetical protein
VNAASDDVDPNQTIAMVIPDYAFAHNVGSRQKKFRFHESPPESC